MCDCVALLLCGCVAVCDCVIGCSCDGLPWVACCGDVYSLGCCIQVDFQIQRVFLWEQVAGHTASESKVAPFRVLEVGAGSGRLTPHLLQVCPSGTELVATDLSASMIDVAKAKVGPTLPTVAPGCTVEFRCAGVCVWVGGAPSTMGSLPYFARCPLPHCAPARRALCHLPCSPSWPCAQERTSPG